MNRDHQNLTQLQLYLTAEYPCSYLPNTNAASQMVAPADAIDTDNYSQLIHLGFRRSGLYVYRPSCTDCKACQSLRIDVAQFKENRSQRRAQKRWAHLHTDTHDLEFNPEHFALYQRYQKSRHTEGDMAKDDTEQYQQFLLQSRVDSFLIEFRDAQNQLVMVSLIDRLADGLSAVYTFYDTDIDYNGLGTFNVLWQISVAKRLNLPYVYLGYWVAASQKMAYKANFSAAEILIDNHWQTFTKNTHVPSD